ncbi:eCIS core domain-containing protein [Sorangium sp. So ce861]|uniref:eCIS core domain-containing protein n=1 Tax=Sorangium sp. So ce861 TaxID=3133323 RepID=UPI003F5E8D49
MKALAQAPPLAEPKNGAPFRAPTRAKAARAHEVDEEYDERMRSALAERATRPVQAKAAFRHGYGDLVTAARATAAPPAAREALRVGAPGDALEREADQIAERITGGAAAPVPAIRAAAAPPVQRACAACAAGAPCAACAEQEDGRVQRKESAAATAAGAVAREDLGGLGPGRALDEQARAYLEPRLGRDLGGVRVHTDVASARMARALGAYAFTQGSDIYFGEGRYRPETQEGRRLLAHELVHTLQQGYAGAPLAQPGAPAATPVEVSTSPGGTAIQRYSWDEFTSDVGDAASGAADAVGDAAGAAWDAGADVVEAGGELLRDGAAFLVRQVSPELADMIAEGPLAFVQRNVERVLGAFFGSVFDIDLAGIVAGLRDSLGASFDAFASAVMGGAANACQLFADVLNAIRDVASAIADNPVVDALRDVLGAIRDAVGKVVSAVAAPVFDLLGDLLGGAWGALRSVASTVWGWIRRVRDLAGDAWDWVAEQLGFGGEDASGEDGIFGWLKRKASEVWESIKETFAPVVGPLRTVATIALALSPVGPIYAIIRYGPQVVSAVQWLWAHRGDPDIIRTAHREMGGTFLPGLLDALAGFRETLETGASWLLEQLLGLSAAMLELLGGITGVPLLSIAEGAVRAIASGVETLLGWAQSGMQAVVGAVTSVASTVWGIVEPYKDVLSSIALAIVNPYAIPIILAGWAWEALPSCFKAPIIDFLLDIAIGALEMVPELMLLGPLWPLLKSGVLGFLRGLRAQTPEVKEAVANKIARILRGSSPDFLIGFVKGFLKGVWEGLTDPIKLIWMVVEGLNHALTFFERLAEDALTPERDRRAAAAAAGATNAAAASAADLGQRAAEMAGELEPPVATVSEQFWAALEEYFDSSGGGSFDTLITKLGELWDAMRTRVEQAGGQLADKVVEFFTADTAEGALGEAVGWLAGMIAFEVALNVVTADTWAAAYPALQVLVRFLNWPMEVLGQAARLLSKIGKYVVDGVRKLGRMVSGAAGGALKSVKEALGAIGEKLVAFAEELLSRFGRGAAREGAEAAERGATHTAERGLAHEAEQEAARRAEQTALREAEERAARGTESAPSRAAHRDAPEVEPGVVSKQTAPDGHEVKVTRDGRVVVCTDCAELRVRFSEELDANPRLKQRLDDIEAIADPAVKNARATELETELVGVSQFPRPSAPAAGAPEVPVAAPELTGESVWVNLADGRTVEFTPAEVMPVDSTGTIVANETVRTPYGGGRVVGRGDNFPSITDVTPPGPARLPDVPGPVSPSTADVAVARAGATTPNGEHVYPEQNLLGSGKHGLQWTEARARAVDTGNPQGQFASVDDINYAVRVGSRIGRGNEGMFPLPPNSRSWVVFPDGSVVRATRVFVKVRTSGVIHAIPYP